MRPAALIPLAILAAGCARKPPLPITGIWLPTDARFTRGLFPDPEYRASNFVEFKSDGAYLNVTHLEAAPGSSPDEDFYDILKGTWYRNGDNLSIRIHAHVTAHGNKGVYTKTETPK